ncbi:amidase [Candidimonas sp. SYP-B2681]|uniref:amidase n=1 Tax=Candidimonas sp. SYP-B2681 TaxID=2497686 RepID=UPI000F88DB36|nr:amidase [Candidimonas sp. SYP-B2681]RTZ41558.1 amidase [Candidimonas sp. SYP-B2681]
MAQVKTADHLADPLAYRGLAGFAEDFRAGRVTSLAVTQAYLARIDAWDGKLGAFQHVAHASALATAKAIDALYAAGTYLGPLMGVPVAIKDVFTIHGMPAPKVGSRMQLPQVTGEEEGPFIQALRRAGCVFLGQTKAVELCLGITGVSAPLGTPWNPYDLDHHRVPGGSSAGSGVAAGAGLCAFAIGTDSGGSVRVPAAYNGVVGLKTTAGLWPTQGGFPLDPRVDSIGLLTKSAVDAAIAFHAISSCLNGPAQAQRVPLIELDGLRLGVPENYFFDGLSDQVAQSIVLTQRLLQESGARLKKVNVPEAGEREAYFPVAMPASILATLGADAFNQQKALMDPVVGTRVATGLQTKAYEYLALEEKRQHSIAVVDQRFNAFDAWVSPTTVGPAPLLSDFDDPAIALSHALGMTRNTQPANYLALCAISLPMPQHEAELPIGIQLMGRGKSDATLLAIAVAVENAIGRQAPPSLPACGIAVARDM